MLKRGLLFLFIGVLLVNVVFVSAAFELTGRASLDNSIWEAESQYPDAQLTARAGITPDSFLYFAEDLIFSRFRSDLENREVKVAEIIEVSEEGNTEAAERSLERYERYAENLAREISPDQTSEVTSSAIAIRRAVSNSQIEEEFALEVLNWEGTIITSVETATVIFETCTELSLSDPVEYSRFCGTTSDSPRWLRNLDRDLIRQQENEVRLFGNVVSECIESSGQTCSCESLSFGEFSEICSMTSSLVSECTDGEETSCQEISENLPAELLNTEMPSYLENLFDTVSSEILQVQIENNYLPGACEEQNLLNPRDCKNYLDENRDSLFPLDPTPRVPPLDPTLPPIKPPRPPGGGGGGGGGGSDPTPDPTPDPEPPVPDPDPTPAPAPTISFGANPNSITSGSSSTLAWSSTNANSCTSSGGWSGLRVVSGVQVVTPTQTTTYTLTCSGDGGSATSSVTVTVTTTSPPPEPDPDPDPEPPPSDGINARSLTANTAQQVTSVTTSSVSPASGSVVLIWVSQTAGAGTSTPTATGLGTSWTLVDTSVRSPPGPRRLSVLRGAPTTSGTLTLNLGGPTENVIWSVVEHTGVDTSSPIVQTATSAANIFETSALATLSSAGQTGSATTGAIFTGGAEAMTPGSGFTQLSQQSRGVSTTGSFWMLTEFKSSFDSTVDASWNTPVHWLALGVELRAGGGTPSPPPPEPPPEDPEAPTISFSASPTSITSGSSSTLTWSSTNANSCTASGGWSGSRSTSGSSSVSPTATTSYTLSCTGDGGSASSSVSITVNAPLPPPSGDCDITVNAASVSGSGVNSAVASASQGDVVCLVRSFTLSHTTSLGNARDGVNSQLFSASVPGITVDGSGATVTGNFQGGDNIAIQVSASNVRITGFTIRTGFIVIADGTSGVQIDNNDISESVSPSGNFGLIRSLGGTTSGPRDITISDNYLHDMYTCGPGSSTSACSGVGSDVNPQPWNTFTGASLINGASIFKQGVDNGGDGTHRVTNNRIERVPALFTFKRSGNDVGILTGNTFADSLRTGRQEGNSLTLSGNTYSNVGSCNDCWTASA